MKTLRIILCFVLLVVMLLSCSGKTLPETDQQIENESVISENETESVVPTPEELYEPFIPVLRFAVCSDIHISIDPNCIEAVRFKKMIESAYDYADSVESYQNLDAVIVVGDLTTEGEIQAYRNIKAIVDESIAEETQFIAMLGNHEHYGNAKAFSFILNQKNNNHVVINGYHFISVSPDIPSNEYSDDLVSWLKSELSTAADDAPEKPIFTFQHHHIADTVYVSNTWRTSSTPGLREAYGEYPQLINFSGHSHAPINHPRTIWQDDFTMIGTGTLSYYSMDENDGFCYRSRPENVAQYTIVEVNADNVVKVMPYNILTGKFMKTPANTDDPDTQLVYYLPTTKDKNDFIYTENQNETASAPYFADDDKVSISDLTPTSAMAIITQAYDDSCIYGYRFEYSDENGVKGSILLSSEYAVEPLMDSISYTITGLEPNTEYTVTVTPINAWYIEGNPISATFKTAAE